MFHPKLNVFNLQIMYHQKIVIMYETIKMKHYYMHPKHQRLLIERFGVRQGINNHLISTV